MVRKTNKKNRKTVKGMPSAVVLSILIHAALFLLAGMLVVFTVVKKEEKKFVPPKAVERPKMKLRKPKVKVKKSSKPKSTTRIVTKVTRADMPDIQLPEMSGMGDGLGGGIGDFDMMPDFSELSIFGSGQSIGNDFVGTFYDFKRDRTSRPIPMNHEDFVVKMTGFIESGWKTSKISRYYRSPKKLYATCFMVPPIKSMLGPRAFGEDTGGWCWMVHYKGKLVYPEDIKFRFWGFADDILLVRVDGKLVLNGCYHQEGGNTYITNIGGSWDSTSSDDARFWYGLNKARVGDWIELKAGEMLDMEVVIGEVPGGEFSAMLTIQVEGEEYERNRQGGPILPMFTTTEPSREIQDAILCSLVRGEASITNGPVFRDYMLMPKTNREEEVAGDSMEGAEPDPKKSVWITTGGKQIEGEYVTIIADKIVFKSPSGKQIKIPFASLSPANREYIELMNPPEFTIDFVKLADSKLGRYKLSPWEQDEGRTPPRVNDFIFGARVKQRGAGKYKHELTVEYFAIGKELLGDKYILLDRKSSTFTLTKENERAHDFKGESIEFVEYDLDGQMRGKRPDGNLVTIKDERGQIIQYKASKSWLWKNIENLKKLPVGAYMDETCNRAYPTSPKPTKW